MRFAIPALFLLGTTLSGCVYIFTITIFSVDPFPTFEFTNRTGEYAAKYLHRWNYGVKSGSIKSVSFKSASSIDSYSKWAKFELSQSDAETLAAIIHFEMGSVDTFSRQNGDYEQRTRSIKSIAIRHPTGQTPLWWKPSANIGDATEIMFWYDSSEIGSAQGCYTVYDVESSVLWVYEYAAQHDTLWERGTHDTLVDRFQGG